MDKKKDLKIEYEYYLANKEELLSKYEGKYIVIFNSKLTGSFKTMKDAIKFGIGEFGLGTFLVKHCLKDNEDHQTFHTRVGIFA